MPLRRTVSRGEDMLCSGGKARVVEEASEDLVGGKVLLGDRPGRPAVGVVVRGDPFGARRRLVRGAEGDEAFADGEAAAEAGILDEGGLARGQVADGAVAEP